MKPISPCPFCGCKDISVIDDWYDSEEGDQVTLMCTSCHCMTRPECPPVDDNGDIIDHDSEEYEDFIDSIIDTWNNRCNTKISAVSLIDTATDLLKSLIPYCNSVGALNANKFKEYELTLKDLKEKINKETK